jgi:hypothetical protein
MKGVLELYNEKRFIFDSGKILGENIGVKGRCMN